jgi:hypothetical protein
MVWRRHNGNGDSTRPRPSGSSEAGPGSLVSRQVEAMVAAWRRGERPTAEQFLARHPDLGTEAALRLIYEEFCLRQEADLEVDPAELVGRFGLAPDPTAYPRPVDAALLERLGITETERAAVPPSAWEGLVLERVALVDLTTPSGHGTTAKH